MDFSFSEDQNAIRDLASQIFTDRTTDEFMLNFDRTDATYDDELWSTLLSRITFFGDNIWNYYLGYIRFIRVYPGKNTYT